MIHNRNKHYVARNEVSARRVGSRPTTEHHKDIVTDRRTASNTMLVYLPLLAWVVGCHSPPPSSEDDQTACRVAMKYCCWFCPLSPPHAWRCWAVCPAWASSGPCGMSLLEKPRKFRCAMTGKYCSKKLEVKNSLKCEYACVKRVMDGKSEKKKTEGEENHHHHHHSTINSTPQNLKENWQQHIQDSKDRTGNHIRHICPCPGKGGSQPARPWHTQHFYVHSRHAS